MDVAKLFQNGRSQAVRLPAAYRFEGDCVRVSRRGRAVILEPMTVEPSVWFAEMDAAGDDEPFPDAHEQPDTPIRDIF